MAAMLSVIAMSFMVVIFLNDVGHVFVRCETLSEGYIVTKATEMPTALRSVLNVLPSGRVNLTLPLNSQQNFRLALKKADNLVVDVYEPVAQECDNVVKISYDGGKTGKEKCTTPFFELGHAGKVRTKELTLTSNTYSLKERAGSILAKNKNLSCALRTRPSKSGKGWHVVELGVLLEKTSTKLKKKCMSFLFPTDARLLIDPKLIPVPQKSYKWIIIIGVITFIVVLLLICVSCWFCIIKKRAKEMAAQDAAIEQIERTRTAIDSTKKIKSSGRGQ